MDIRSFLVKAAPPAAGTAPAPAGTAEGPSAARAPPAEPAPPESCGADQIQDFVNFFNNHARLPTLKSGKALTSRRAVVYGKRYYWGERDTKPINALPASFRAWAAKHGFAHCNSFVVQVYDSDSSHIDWHSDLTAPLKSPEVACVSFALNKRDRDKTLADMQFRWPVKGDKSNIKKGSSPIHHGTIVRFNADKHFKKGCQHRVPKTLAPRVSVSMRSLK